jgi:REP element-mobilizing transposase RayT
MTDTEKYKGKYRIPSARWAAWDYGANAAYFVTLCTADRRPDFGTITHGVMTPTPLGLSAQACWYEIPAHFPFVELGAFVVMPNHVHGIVIINKPVTPGVVVVETQNIASLQPQSAHPQNIASPPKNRFGPQSQNLASIVRGYKIGVTKYARQNQIPFAWQPRYYDHVIRNAAEHERIHQYILTNVQHWEEDSLHHQPSDQPQQGKGAA